MSFDTHRVDSFLHTLGYNYFTMGGLTYIEMNDLVEVENQQRAEQRREASRRK